MACVKSKQHLEIFSKIQVMLGKLQIAEKISPESFSKTNIATPKQQEKEKRKKKKGYSPQKLSYDVPLENATIVHLGANK